jgi:hypothetical protein
VARVWAPLAPHGGPPPPPPPYEQRFGEHSVTVLLAESAVARAKVVAIEVVVWAVVGSTYYAYRFTVVDRVTVCVDTSSPADPFKDPRCSSPKHPSRIESSLHGRMHRLRVRRSRASL